jgi:two-component system, NarL family, invasion response regulator UvrY
LKILITDDHKIVREGLKEILQHLPEVSAIEEAKNGKEALVMISREDFDLILLDISLPDISGLEVLQSIKRNHPLQRVLILSMYNQEHYALRALKMGASGYLTKDSASEELIDAVRKIISGRKYITSSLVENIALHLENDYSKPLHETLSGREFEIMLMIAAGKPLREIGSELFISGKTVSTYRSRIMGKMGMKKNAEIINYCLRNRLVD